CLAPGDLRLHQRGGRTSGEAVCAPDGAPLARRLPLQGLLAGHGYLQGQDHLRSDGSAGELSLDGLAQMSKLPKLKAGERVRVRSKQEILATLDRDGTLGGMPFMPEMLDFCGTEFAVAAVAHKTCDTACKTGGRALDRMVHLAGTRCDGKSHGGCEADCNLFW